MRKLFFLILILCFAFPSFSQNKLSVVRDSIKNSFRQESTFFINLDSHNSFIGGHLASIGGIKAGLSYGRLVRTGIGIFGLTSDYYSHYHDPSNPEDTIRKQIRFSYFGVFFDYTIYEKNNWMFSVPLQFGFGGSSYEYYKKNIGVVNESSQGIALFETAVTGHYKIIRYLGIGLGAGFRVMLVPNRRIHEQFTSPIYVFRLKIFMSEIYHDVFPRGLFGKKPTSG